ncbi:MAG TPA: S8 family serine peptidase [Actinomycetota bacterium]|jgi:subtilisin family serine protease|nr:S8 family serine peptidase [Actinomycetota bacterium]
MPGFEGKFDSGLRRIYRAFMRARRGERVGAPPDLPVPENGLLNITIQYTGELAALEALGFKPIQEEGPGRATGTVDLAELEPLGSDPAVLSMRFGEPMEPRLDKSVPDVQADKVWTLTAGTFTGTTGNGVLVAIIDTGIDWRHDFFLRTSAPKATRILKIWDQGLTKVGAEVTPLGAGLAGAPDYGVEYTDVHIDAQLQGAPGAMAVRHLDCVGHGTHVASIAAGDGRSAFTFVGVAPEADLIAVKLLDIQAVPNDPNPPHAPLGFDQRFRDAVDYVLKVADDLGKPVVINMSFGSDLGPHDGFADDEDFLTHTFPPATVGKVAVAAAGNSAAKRQHARIEFAAAGDVEIPLELFDERGAKKLDFRQCVNVPGTRPAGVEVWYPSGATTLTGEIKVPGAAVFDAGPALGAADVTGVLSGRAWHMAHSSDTQVLRSGAGTVTRNQFEFVIEPFRNRHVFGHYTLKLTASGPLTAHLWSRRVRFEGMRLHPAVAMPAGVVVEDRFLIGTEGGAANVITVAAHDAEVATRDITDFSARGPLVAHGPLPVAQPAKPDIAAPGEHIDAAKSGVAKPWGPNLIAPKRGTSMSSPHVAGAVALLLEKKPAMTVAEVFTALKANASTAPPATAEEAGAGRLDAKKSFDSVP